MHAILLLALLLPADRPAPGPARATAARNARAQDPGAQAPDWIDLNLSWIQAKAAWDRKLRSTRGKERQAVLLEDPAPRFFPLFAKLADEGHGRALSWMALHAEREGLPKEQEHRRKVELFDRLFEEHAHSSWLVEVVGKLPRQRRWLGDERIRGYLRRAFELNENDTVRVEIGFELAEYTEKHFPPAEAAKDYGLIVAAFPGTTAAKRAAAKVFELEKLCTGCEAPALEGRDVDGGAVRLADLRGKVVVLDFWGFW